MSAIPEFLAAAGVRRHADDELDFGDAAGELAAAAAGTVAVPLCHLGLVGAAGEDAADFLQNLLTNDVKKLGAGAAQRNGLCSAKGRLLANFLVWREDGEILLQLARELQAGVQKKLAMYVLRSRVKLRDAGAASVLLGLAGPDAEKLLAELGLAPEPAPLSLARADGLLAIRLSAQRFQLSVAEARAAQIWQRLAAGARPAGTPVWRWLEIAAGIPLIGARTQEEFVPQMANLDLVGGVSFQKGCYPGQEIVARTQYLGRLKRRMYLAHLAGGAPAAGDSLYGGDDPTQSCGMVVNAAPAPGGGHDLLAVIQMTSAEAGEVRLGAADGPPLEFRPLPYAAG